MLGDFNGIEDCMQWSVFFFFFFEKLCPDGRGICADERLKLQISRRCFSGYASSRVPRQ